MIFQNNNSHLVDSDTHRHSRFILQMYSKPFLVRFHFLTLSFCETFFNNAIPGKLKRLK